MNHHSTKLRTSLTSVRALDLVIQRTLYGWSVIVCHTSVNVCKHLAIPVVHLVRLIWCLSDRSKNTKQTLIRATNRASKPNPNLSFSLHTLAIAVCENWMSDVFGKSFICPNKNEGIKKHMPHTSWNVAVPLDNIICNYSLFGNVSFHCYDRTTTNGNSFAN